MLKPYVVKMVDDYVHAAVARLDGQQPKHHESLVFDIADRILAELWIPADPDLENPSADAFEEELLDEIDRTLEAELKLASKR